MSLPPGYNSSFEYITDCISFLKEYQWLFNYPNTQVFVKEVFLKFPEEWTIYFKDLPNADLNNIPVGRMQVINFFYS